MNITYAGQTYKVLSTEGDVMTVTPVTVPAPETLVITSRTGKVHYAYRADAKFGRAYCDQNTTGYIREADKETVTCQRCIRHRKIFVG